MKGGYRKGTNQRMEEMAKERGQGGLRDDKRKGV